MSIKRIFRQKVTPHRTAKARAEQRRQKAYQEEVQKQAQVILDNPLLQGAMSSTSLPGGYNYLYNTMLNAAVSASDNKDAAQAAKENQKELDKQMGAQGTAAITVPLIGAAAASDLIPTFAGLSIGAGAAALGNKADNYLADTDSETARWIGEHHGLSTVGSFAGYGAGAGLARAAMPTVKIGNIELNPEQLYQALKVRGIETPKWFPRLKAWSAINEYNNSNLPVIARNEVYTQPITDAVVEGIVPAIRTTKPTIEPSRTAKASVVTLSQPLLNPATKSVVPAETQYPINWHNILSDRVSKAFPDLDVVKIHHDTGEDTWAIVSKKHSDPKGGPMIVKDGFTTDWKALSFLDSEAASNTYWEAFRAGQFSKEPGTQLDVDIYQKLVGEEFELADAYQRTGDPKVLDLYNQKRIERINAQKDITTEQANQYRDRYSKSLFNEQQRLALDRQRAMDWEDAYNGPDPNYTHFYVDTPDDLEFYVRQRYGQNAKLHSNDKIAEINEGINQRGRDYMEALSEIGIEGDIPTDYNRMYDLYQNQRQSLLSPLRRIDPTEMEANQDLITPNFDELNELYFYSPEAAENFGKFLDHYYQTHPFVEPRALVGTTSVPGSFEYMPVFRVTSSPQRSFHHGIFTTPAYNAASIFMRNGDPHTPWATEIIRPFANSTNRNGIIVEPGDVVMSRHHAPTSPIFENWTTLLSNQENNQIDNIVEGDYMNLNGNFYKIGSKPESIKQAYYSKLQDPRTYMGSNIDDFIRTFRNEFGQGGIDDLIDTSGGGYIAPDYINHPINPSRDAYLKGVTRYLSDLYPDFPIVDELNVENVGRIQKYLREHGLVNSNTSLPLDSPHIYWKTSEPTQANRFTAGKVAMNLFKNYPIGGAITEHNLSADSYPLLNSLALKNYGTGSGQYEFLPIKDASGKILHGSLNGMAHNKFVIKQDARNGNTIVSFKDSSVIRKYYPDIKLDYEFSPELYQKLNNTGVKPGDPDHQKLVELLQIRDHANFLKVKNIVDLMRKHLPEIPESVETIRDYSNKTIDWFTLTMDSYVPTNVPYVTVFRHKQGGILKRIK